MANNIGTYTGGNSSITNSVGGGGSVVAARVIRGVSRSRSEADTVDIQPVTSARCRLRLLIVSLMGKRRFVLLMSDDNWLLDVAIVVAILG
jgi:hypothetical protein